MKNWKSILAEANDKQKITQIRRDNMGKYDDKWSETGLPSHVIRELRSSGLSDRDLLRGANEAVAVSPTGRVTTDDIISNARAINAQEAKFGSGNYVSNSPYNDGNFDPS